MPELITLRRDEFNTFKFKVVDLLAVLTSKEVNREIVLKKVEDIDAYITHPNKLLHVPDLTPKGVEAAPKTAPVA